VFGEHVIKLKLSNGALVLGIEARNIEHFKAGHPLHMHGTEIGGFDGVTALYIVYGETLNDAYTEINKALGGQLPPFEEPQRHTGEH
jgi:hypothetical protein